MNKFLSMFAIGFAILSVGILSTVMVDTKGVMYEGENPKIINVAAVPDAGLIFTNNFSVDLSPNIVSVDTGIVKFDGIGGFEPDPVWILTKLQRSGDNSFSEWVKQVSEGQNVRKDITINILKRDQSIARTFTCLDAFPINYNYGDIDASSPEILSETLTVKCNRVEMR